MGKHSIIFNGKSFDISKDSRNDFYSEIKTLMNNHEYNKIIKSVDNILSSIDGLEKIIYTLNELTSEKTLKDYKSRYDFLFEVKYVFWNRSEIDEFITFNHTEENAEIIYFYIKYLYTLPNDIFMRGYNDVQILNFFDGYLSILNQRYNIERKLKIKNYLN
jgi:hypothetical protein